MRKLVVWVGFFVIVGAMILILFCGSNEEKLIYTQAPVCVEEFERGKYTFLNAANKSGIVIPGLKHSFVPQGIAYWKEKNRLIISGYFKPVRGNCAGILFLLDADSGELVADVMLLDKQGKMYSGHYSGIAVVETDLYLADGYNLHRISLKKIELEGSRTVRIEHSYPISIKAATCTYTNGVLWVCEHIRSRDSFAKKVEQESEEYRARMIGYDLAGEFLVPVKMFLVPDEVQGISILNDGQMVLSCSYGRKRSSTIMLYKDPSEESPVEYKKLRNKYIPVWVLGKNAEWTAYSAPPMAEGCCAIGDEVYLIFESAAYFYHLLDPDYRAVDPTDEIWIIKPTE